LVFILTLGLYVRIRRPADASPRAVMYRALEKLTEVLDADLEVDERRELESDLADVVIRANDGNVRLLAVHLEQMLRSSELVVAPSRESRWGRVACWWDEVNERPGTRTAFLLFLLLGMIGLSIRPTLRLGQAAQVYLAGLSATDVGAVLAPNSPFSPDVSNGFLVALAGFEGMLGLLLVISCALITLRREGTGVRLCRRSLWLYVGVLNIPLFYVNQFSAMGLTILQFIVLWSLAQYRERHMQRRKELAVT
jgi:hypothetical protein